jgi:hypothetical protein
VVTSLAGTSDSACPSRANDSDPLARRDTTEYINIHTLDGHVLPQILDTLVAHSGTFFVQHSSTRTSYNVSSIAMRAELSSSACGDAWHCAACASLSLFLPMISAATSRGHDNCCANARITADASISWRDIAAKHLTNILRFSRDRQRCTSPNRTHSKHESKRMCTSVLEPYCPFPWPATPCMVCTRHRRKRDVRISLSRRRASLDSAPPSPSVLHCDMTV